MFNDNNDSTTFKDGEEIFITTQRPRGRPPGSKTKQLDKQKMVRPTSFGQVNVAEGDNAKYLSHALQVAQLPLIDLGDPEAVRQRCNEYFQLCAQNDMKPTVSGLATAFKTNRRTVLAWKTGEFRKDSHQAIILEAYTIMESLWEDYMQNGKINPVAGIFLGKNNYDYADKQEVTLTPGTGGLPQAADVKAIEAKYAELPED